MLTLIALISLCLLRGHCVTLTMTAILASVTTRKYQQEHWSVLNVVKVSRKLAVGISPFLAEDPSKASKMTRYANRAAQDATNRNEALIMANLAFLSPLGATAVERDDAFLNLLSWIPRADVVAVYVDYGFTPAMQVAISVAVTKNKKIEYRSVGEV